MNRIDQYIEKLSNLPDWTDYLLSESHLPGPRGNLELAQAVVTLGSGIQFERFLEWTADRAPENTPNSFLAFCGTWGLGKLIANGDQDRLATLRIQANDTRWRVREASAMALQTIGDSNMPLLLRISGQWLHGTWLEQRALVAGLCEPRLLKDRETASQVLRILDLITTHIAQTNAGKDLDRRVLRQALGYGWSVAIVSSPEIGKQYFKQWAGSNHPDIIWVLKENCKKKRLIRLDPVWVQRILVNSN